MDTENNGARVLDLGALKSLDEAVMDVIHPATDQPTGWQITFAGPAHPKTIAQEERLERERLQLERERDQKLSQGLKWRPPERSLDERSQRNVLMVAERIVGWSPAEVTLDGATYQVADATKLLNDPYYGWLFRQCFAFLTNEKSFTRRSATA